MLRRGPSLLLSLLFVLPACSPSGWAAGHGFLAEPAHVASALGDPLPDAPLEPRDLPHLDPPHHRRPCCAFGMDIEVDFAGLHVPFFEVSNVIERSALGAHAYALADGATDPEGNGLVYTCRGGFIDTAHVRETADLVLFLAVRLATTLASGTTVELEGHGGTMTLVARPVPEHLVARGGRIAIASAMAGWAAYRISIWHEAITWLGAEDTPGFSERASAFSLEDLYSNALGVRLAMVILRERAFGTDREYDLVFAAYLDEALAQLEAQPRLLSRQIMTALDGRWWDSSRRLPDNRLVLRRAFPRAEDVVRPWRAEDAFARDEVPAALVEACDAARTRELALPDSVGRAEMRELMEIRWDPDAWGDVPLAPPGRIVDERELDELVGRVHFELERELGEDFDRPGPPREAETP